MRPVLAALALLLRVAVAHGDEVPVAEDYRLHCSACHGSDGSGTPGVTPSLAAVGEIFAVAGGRAYLAQVPGVAQAPLSDSRLARLLNWVVERHAGAAPEPPYSADEVGRLRQAPLRDPAAVRPTLGP